MKSRIIIPQNKKVLAAITLLVVKTFIQNTNFFTIPNFLDTLLAVIASAFFLLSIFEKDFSVKTILIYTGIALLSLYSSYKIGNVGFLITIITCLSVREENINSVIQYIFLCEIILLIATMLISIILATFDLYSIYSNIDGTIRCNFGFRHPNLFSMILLNLILMWVWINYKTLKILNIISIFFVELIAYYFSQTSSTLIIVSLLCIMLFFVIVRKKANNLLIFSAKIITPFLAFSTYFLSILYFNRNTVSMLINQLLNSRIALSSYALYELGITVFGNNLNNFKMTWDAFWRLSSFTFDNIYSYFFSNIGIIWLLIVSISFYYLAKKRSNKICIYIITWAMYGMVEVHGINCYHFFPLLMITYLLSTKPQKYI